MRQDTSPPTEWRPATTIPEVVDRLTEVIEWSRANSSRLGYFPSLYRKVTIEVGRRIEEGYFDDGERMERLDVIFANRYLQAIDGYRAGRPITRSWRFAFRVAKHRTPIVLQHLLLGMQAHISLDLGVAAATVAPGDSLPDLEGDFLKINEVLSELTNEVRDELTQIWSSLRVLDRYLGPANLVIVNFSIAKARDWAWSVAQQLAHLPPDERKRYIEAIDFEVAALARLIRYPGITMSAVTKVVRLGERGSTSRKIDYLCSWTWPREAEA